MKKFLILLCVALVSLGASAQKGEQNVGAHLLYGTDIGNIGVGAKYQYNVTDNIRLEGVGDYYLKTDGVTMFDLNVNGHYLFPINDKVTLYPLVGLNFTHWKQDEGGVDYDDNDYEKYSDDGDSDDSWSLSDSSIGLNLGGGVQYTLTDKVRIGAELKYQTISGFNTIVIGVGVTFKL